MKTVAALPHIHLDEHGRPWLDDTNVKVIEVVLDHLGYGWGAETIQENHPHLSLAQVYAALAWYYDHQSELDDEITKQENRLGELRAAVAPSPLRGRRSSPRLHSEIAEHRCPPSSRGRESAPSSAEGDQRRLTSAATVQGFKAQVLSGNSHPQHR